MGFGVWDLRLVVEGLVFRVSGNLASVGSEAPCFNVLEQGLGFGIWGSGFGIWGLGLNLASVGSEDPRFDVLEQLHTHVRRGAGIRILRPAILEQLDKAARRVLPVLLTDRGSPFLLTCDLGFGFRVWGLGFGVWDLGFRALATGLRSVCLLVTCWMIFT